MLLISIFHLGQPSDDDAFCSVLSDLFFFFFVIVFQFVELEQRTVGTDPYFPRTFYFLSQINFFYNFKTLSCHYSSLVLQLGCVQFLGTQLYFKDASLFLFSNMLLVPSSSSHAHSSQAGRQFFHQYFRTHFPLVSNLPPLTRMPFWQLIS